MAFKIHTIDDGRVPPIEYIDADSGLTPDIGTLLYVDSATGKAKLATGTQKPTHICNTVNKGDTVAAIRIGSDMVLETTASVAITQKVGAKVTTTGTQVTNTATDGVAEIVALDGTEAGAKVYVRF